MFETDRLLQSLPCARHASNLQGPGASHFVDEVFIGYQVSVEAKEQPYFFSENYCLLFFVVLFFHNLLGSRKRYTSGSPCLLSP